MQTTGSPNQQASGTDLESVPEGTRCFWCGKESVYGLNVVVTLPDGTKGAQHFYACESHKDEIRGGGPDDAGST